MQRRKPSGRALFALTWAQLGLSQWSWGQQQLKEQLPDPCPEVLHRLGHQCAWAQLSCQCFSTAKSLDFLGTGACGLFQMKGAQSIIFQSNQQAQWGIENCFLCWKDLCVHEENKGSLWIRGFYFANKHSVCLNQRILPYYKHEVLFCPACWCLIPMGRARVQPSWYQPSLQLVPSN